VSVRGTMRNFGLPRWFRVKAKMFLPTVKCSLVIVLLLSQPFNSQLGFAWSGYDYEKGSHVEIEKGNLVRPGRDIEIYDYQAGEYRDVEVESVRRYGGSVEVEVYDHQTGEHRTLEMDD
jgi:hypothetical protein